MWHTTEDGNAFSPAKASLPYIWTFLLVIAQNQETFPHVLNFRPCSAGPFLKRGAAQWLFSISSSKWLFSIHQQVSHGLNELPLSVVQAMATNWQKIAYNHQQPLCHPVTDLDFELHGRFICALPISSNRWKPTQKLLQRFCYIGLKIWGYIAALGSGKTQISEIFKRSMGSIDVRPYSL